MGLMYTSSPSLKDVAGTPSEVFMENICSTLARQLERCWEQHYPRDRGTCSRRMHGDGSWLGAGPHIFVDRAHDLLDLPNLRLVLLVDGRVEVRHLCSAVASRSLSALHAVSRAHRQRRTYEQQLGMAGASEKGAHLLEAGVDHNLALASVNDLAHLCSTSQATASEQPPLDTIPERQQPLFLRYPVTALR